MSMSQMTKSPFRIYLVELKIKIKAISGHLNSVNNCQFVDNDTKLFTASNDLTARIWDSETGKELRNYADLHASYITMAKMSDNDQKYIYLILCSILTEIWQTLITVVPWGYIQVSSIVPHGAIFEPGGLCA